MANKAPAELKIIEATYAFVVWSCQHVGKFPRSHRYTLGAKLETRLLGVLESLIRAKFRRDRLALLQEVNLELELLRIEFRLAKDLQCLAVESYGSASRFVNEIGRQLGGWIRQSNQTPKVAPQGHADENVVRTPWSGRVSPEGITDETTGTSLAARDEFHEPAPIRAPRRPR